MTTVSWRMLRESDNTYDDDLLDVEITDAYNRFARSATAVLDDPTGSKRADYPKATPVSFEYKRNIDSSWTTRFGGFVIQHGTSENTLDLEVLGHDLWLRRRQVIESYSSTAISTILKDLITQYTPLTWDSAQVTVANDRTIDIAWQGQTLATAIGDLADASANELYGADNSGTFFFRQRDADAAPRNFPVGEYLSAEFSEDGKQEVNKVTVYYGSGGSNAVSVQDRESQKQLQDDLGAPRPVVIEQTKSLPEISTEQAALRKARSLLNGATSIRTGDLTTWEAFDVYPGDVTHVTVPDQNVDGDYRVAECTYKWREDETVLKLAEQSEGVVDVLSNLSDEQTRIDTKSADPAATILEVVALDQSMEVEMSGELVSMSVSSTQLTLGDWQGGLGHPDVGGGYLGDQRGSRTTEVTF